MAFSLGDYNLKDSAIGQQEPKKFHRSGKSSQFTFLDMILPPLLIPLFILLLALAPMVLLSGESLFIPLFEWIKSIVLPNSTNTFTILPVQFFLKLGGFLILTFLGAVQIFLRIKTQYYTAWASLYERPHKLHTDYSPDFRESMMALLNWNIFRFMIIVLPPLVIGALTFGVGVFELYLFNQFIGNLPAITLPILFITGLFILMLLGLFFLVACCHSVWMLVKTLFGDVAAVLEPSLPARTVYERCRRIAFAAPEVFLLYPAYILLILATLGEIAWLYLNFDIQDLISGHIPNLGLIVGMECLTLITYLVLNYFKLNTYHHALKRYYARLPQQYLEHFSPPAYR